MLYCNGSISVLLFYLKNKMLVTTLWFFFFHMFTTDSAPAVNAELSGYGGATGPSLGPGCDCLGVGIALEERVW